MANEDANVSGDWFNELGSKMKITQSDDGGLEGEYINQAPGSETFQSEKLVGSIGKGVPATLGFVVNFEGGKFTTTWSGQYQKDGSGKEAIMTTWLMTANLENPTLYWEAVNVGQDRFTREEKKLGGRKSLAAKHAK